MVHDGFHKTQGRTADIVLSTVKSVLSSTGYKRVLVTGTSRLVIGVGVRLT